MSNDIRFDDAQCDGKQYNRAYNELCVKYTIEQLWNRAEVYHFVPR